MEPLEVVVLALVTVALAVAVIFWLANLATQHTGIELLELKATAWKLNGKTLLALYVWNRGTKTATILHIKVNGELHPAQATVEPGASTTITLELETTAPALQVSVVTTRNEYPLIVKP